MLRTEEEIKKKTEKCRHFTGLFYKVCKAGIAYVDVTDVDAKYPTQTIPCLPPHVPELPCKTSCAKFDPWTREEVEEQDRQSEQRIKEYFGAIKSGLCPNHKTPMTKKQVGKCVYALPCGCRLYQGKA